MCKLIRRCNLHIKPKRRSPEVETPPLRQQATEIASESRHEWDTHELWLRGRIRDLVQHVLEEADAEFLRRAKSARCSDTDKGSGCRNGYARLRKLTPSSGTTGVSGPRVRTTEEKFESRLLPLFTQRTNEVPNSFLACISTVCPRGTSIRL